MKNDADTNNHQQEKKYVGIGYNPPVFEKNRPAPPPKPPAKVKEKSEKDA